MDKNEQYFSATRQKIKKYWCALRKSLVKRQVVLLVFFCPVMDRVYLWGRNWVHRIQEALDQTSVMVVFITPNSLRSSWIYFEAGFVYSKKIRVVPVGFLGSDLAHIPPPLSLLQGFNIKNKDGLDNLIALVNDVYSFKYISSFTVEEYDQLVSFGGSITTHPLAEVMSMTNEIKISLKEKEHLKVTADEGFKLAVEELAKTNIEYRQFAQTIEAFGMTISRTNDREPIKFVLDPTLLDSTLPLVINILNNISPRGIKDVSIVFVFVHSVKNIESSHKLTAKLFGTGVSLGNEKGMFFNDLVFSTSYYSYIGLGHKLSRGATYLSITPQKENIVAKEIWALLELLFSKKVLYEEIELVSIDD